VIRRFLSGKAVAQQIKGTPGTAKVESAVRDLLYDRGRAKAMSLVQRSTIDGLGMIRVAQAIDDLF